MTAARKRDTPPPPPDAVKELLHAFFENHPEVILAYLFGSFITRKTGSFNDIDIAVLVIPERLEELDRSSPYGYAAYVIAELAHLLKYDRIDLTILNRAPPLLLRRVIGEGMLVFCRSESDRVRFEVASLKRYADTAHLRTIKRHYMRQRIKKGKASYA
ncbi:MAG: type VII toxin-antitoxin system MntA family adenylyltransferase antitoxin [bacterium]